MHLQVNLTVVVGHVEVVCIKGLERARNPLRLLRRWFDFVISDYIDA